MKLGSSKCTACGRSLKNWSEDGLGPVCRRAITGAKPRAVKRESPTSRDSRQLDLLEARA